MVNINLLPPEIKLKIKKAKQSANIFSICLVVTIVIIVLTFLLSAYNNQLLKPQLNNLNQEADTASKSLANFNQLQNAAAFLTDRGKLAAQIDNTRANWSEILGSMINSVPSDVQFVSLTADVAKSPNFSLQGTTSSEPEAIKFKDKLASSSFFKDVAFKSSTTNNSQSTGAGGIQFTLEFNLAQFFAKTGTTK